MDTPRKLSGFLARNKNLSTEKWNRSIKRRLKCSKIQYNIMDHQTKMAAVRSVVRNTGINSPFAWCWAATLIAKCLDDETHERLSLRSFRARVSREEQRRVYFQEGGWQRTRWMWKAVRKGRYWTKDSWQSTYDNRIPKIREALIKE